jgi:hypothetical protein
MEQHDMTAFVFFQVYGLGKKCSPENVDIHDYDGGIVLPLKALMYDCSGKVVKYHCCSTSCHYQNASIL